MRRIDLPRGKLFASSIPARLRKAEEVRGSITFALSGDGGNYHEGADLRRANCWELKRFSCATWRCPRPPFALGPRRRRSTWLVKRRLAATRSRVDDGAVIV
jgi:hypothetical protein